MRVAGEYLSEGRNGHGVQPREQFKRANDRKHTRFCRQRPAGVGNGGEATNEATASERMKHVNEMQILRLYGLWQLHSQPLGKA